MEDEVGDNEEQCWAKASLLCLETNLSGFSIQETLSSVCLHALTAAPQRAGRHRLCARRPLDNVVGHERGAQKEEVLNGRHESGRVRAGARAPACGRERVGRRRRGERGRAHQGTPQGGPMGVGSRLDGTCNVVHLEAMSTSSCAISHVRSLPPLPFIAFTTHRPHTKHQYM